MKLSITHFIQLQRKQASRSPIMGSNKVVTVVVWLFIVYMLANFLLLGFVVDILLEKAFPDKPVIGVFHSFVVYFLLADMGARLYLQNLPTMDVQSLRHLPIRRSSILHFMLGKSYLSFFNFYPLLILVPFAIKQIGPAYGSGVAVVWVFGLIFLYSAMHYKALYLKRLLMSSPFGVLSILAFVGVLFLTEYLAVFSLSALSEEVLNAFLAYPFAGLAISAFLPVITYSWQFLYLKRHFYFEEGTTTANVSTSKVGSGIMGLLNRYYGEAGSYMVLEAKLIWRNKRPKSLVNLSFIFLAYGFLFYPQEMYINNNLWLIFVGLVLTSMLTMNYGQFLMAWESHYFDGIMAKRINLSQFLKAKYFLMVTANFVFFSVSLFYAVFFGWRIAAINFAMFLYSAGVVPFVLLYFGMNNRKSLELDKGSSFNWQGVGVNQFVLSLPIFLLPMAMFYPFDYFGQTVWGFACIGGIGAIGIAFREWILAYILERFQLKRHAMAAGFRRSA